MSRKKPMETIAIHQPLHVLKLPTACSATSAHFYLPPRYETPVLNVNVSLDMANLQMVNITTLHLAHGNTWETITVTPNCNTCHQSWCTKFINISSIVELVHPPRNIPSILVHKVYQHLLNSGACSPTQEYMFQL